MDKTEYEEEVFKKYNKRECDELVKRTNKCIETVKQDLKNLPCKNPTLDCPQERHIINIQETLKDITKTQHDLQVKTIQPLLETQALLNQKQDKQQQSLDKIIETQEKINEQMLKDAKSSGKQQVINTKEMTDILTQLTKINTSQDTKEQVYDRTMSIIKWSIGIIVAGLSIYFGILQIMSG